MKRNDIFFFPHRYFEGIATVNATYYEISMLESL